MSNSGISTTIGSIAEFKSMKINEISKAIEDTKIQLDGITYWSISDTLDHNLERTNRKTYEQGLRRDIAMTRYAGLYSNPESRQSALTEDKKDVKENVIVNGQDLGKQVSCEISDTLLVDETEREIKKQ